VEKDIRGAHAELCDHILTRNLLTELGEVWLYQVVNMHISIYYGVTKVYKCPHTYILIRIRSVCRLVVTKRG